jgi:predicted Ser/Thr protein kinase
VLVWLDQEAADDADIREEVSSLLRNHWRTGAFLSEPVSDRLPDLLDEGHPLEPGNAIGTYTIVRELGRGGMGRVYLARDERLGRAVAVKALLPRLTANPSSRDRLRREAQAAARLTHSGICTVYALEEINGELFIVTEYVDGHTLREEIDTDRAPTADAVRHAAGELASALAAAHASGIVHRDLKPENVMRTRDGHLKILDFGLARVSAASEQSIGVTPMTQAGLIMGTPAYMAPEQFNGQPIDARTDVFALGVLLYEYACGVHPFEGGTPLATMARILESDARPMIVRRPSLPADLAEVVDRCLRKSPDDRFMSAMGIVDALRHERPARAPGGIEVPWWRTHQLAAIGLYIVASVVAWQIKEVSGTPLTRWLFVAIGIGSAVSGIVRGHLLFTERVYRTRLVDEQRRTKGITLVADLLTAACVLADGILLASAHPLNAVFTIALALGIGLARAVIEPATTIAAFGDRP